MDALRPAAIVRAQMAMAYRKGSHSTFHHRYHIVWAPKYRFKVLHGEVRNRVRAVIRQVGSEMGVTISNGVLSRRYWTLFDFD
jgi:putative transposase